MRNNNASPNDSRVLRNKTTIDANKEVKTVYKPLQMPQFKQPSKPSPNTLQIILAENGIKRYDTKQKQVQKKNSRLSQLKLS